jgi:TRAP-type C4-dicarboxylate transport system substrate-binding protein
MAGLAVVAVSAQAVRAETTLLFNQWVPHTHHFHARIVKPWADRVTQATEGRVKINFTTASLGAPPRQFELALTGVAALAAGNQSYTPERFPLAMFAELPFLATNAEALSVANWRVTQQHIVAKKDEYAGTKLLTVFSNGGAMVFTRKTDVQALGDINNLKLRAAGGLPTEVARRLGGVPVGAPITEAYQMLSRGIVDGTLLPPDSIYSFKMNKFIEHMTQPEQGLFSSTFFVVMNGKAWAALPKADQDAIMSVSGEGFARQAGAIWDDQDKKAMAAFKEGGMKIRQADPALDKALRERLAPIEAEWVKSAAEHGVDGKAVLAAVRAEIAGYKPAK